MREQAVRALMGERLGLPLYGLSVREPWATAISVGLKPMETRAWRPREAVPCRLVICAAAKRPKPGPIAGGTVRLHTDTEGSLVEEWFTWTPAGGQPLDDPPGVLDHLPLRLSPGRAIASCVLASCARIGEPESFTTGTREGVECPTADEDVVVRHPDHGFGEFLVLDRWNDTSVDMTDQLLLGDYSTGRWAWLLEDVARTEYRCPRCWGEGVLRAEGPFAGLWVERERACPTCAGRGKCAPPPVRGKQGLFAMEWED